MVVYKIWELKDVKLRNIGVVTRITCVKTKKSDTPSREYELMMKEREAIESAVQEKRQQLID